MVEEPDAARYSKPATRPPWKWMAVLALVGAGLIAAGMATGYHWIAWVGVVPLALAPNGLFVPGLRISYDRRPVNGYRDMHDFGGLMTILGFTAAERDAAFTRKRGEQSDESQP